MRTSVRSLILKIFLLCASIGIIIWLGYYFIFSKSGLIDQRRALAKIASLNRTADSLLNIKNQLEDYLQSLHRGDRRTLERAARHIGMVKPNERVIIFQFEDSLSHHTP